MIARALQHPLTQFLLIGILLCGTEWAWNRHGWTLHKQDLFVSTSQQDQLVQEWKATHNHPPSEIEKTDLIRQWVDDEILYQESLKRQLHQNNPTVRSRLISLMSFLDGDAAISDETRHQQALALHLDQTDLAIRRYLTLQMRLLLSLPDHPQPITDTELQDFLAGHADQYIKPASIRFKQIFFSKNLMGTNAKTVAKRVLHRLRHQQETTDVNLLGNPFPYGTQITEMTEEEIDARFGGDIRRKLMQAIPDQWTEPVQSVYGWHLLRVYKKQAAKIPRLDTLRPQLIEALRTERAATQYAARLAAIKRQYDIRIEPAMATKTTPAFRNFVAPRKGTEMD